MATNILAAQLQNFTLAGSGSAEGDTTLQLSSFTDIDGNPVTMAAFGTIGYGTIEPGYSQEEQISFTGVTQNSNGTATLTGVSNVGFLSPYTVTAHLLKPHAGGVIFIITNTSAFYSTFANTEDTETISQVWTFSATPQITNDPTLNKDAANKEYVDGVAVAGAPNANTTTKGIVQIATGAQLAAGTATGSTGAAIVPAGSSFKNSSAGAGSANIIPVLNGSGLLDASFLNGGTYDLSNTSITMDTGSTLAVQTPTLAAQAATKAYVDKSFFGSGADGALTASSGTTTLNTSGKNIYQYTSVSLTGTAALTVGSNLQNLPLFIFVQGNLTITASGTSVSLKGFGGQLGTTVAGLSAANPGTSGATASVANFGGGATASGNGSVDRGGSGGGGGGGFGNAGTNGTTPTSSGVAGTGGVSSYLYNANIPISREIERAFIGGGGGGGATGDNSGADGAGGNGGNGGGCVIFIVGGNINLTTGTIDVSGNNGSNGAAGASIGGGGGGGGGGGFCGIYYAGTSTANSIAFTVSGGSGGTASNSGGAGGAGGAGQYEIRPITVVGLPL